MALTLKQDAFVTKYLELRNGTQAAIAAGYSPASAREISTENLRKPAVQAALAERQGEAARQADITREQVIAGIRAAIAEARLIGDPMAQIRGWSEIAKMLGYYAPETKRVELSTESARRRAELEMLGDEELLALVGEPEGVSR